MAEGLAAWRVIARMTSYTLRRRTISATSSAEISATLSADDLQSDIVSSSCRRYSSGGRWCVWQKEEDDRKGQVQSVA